MNPRIKKLRAEQKRVREKIAALQGKDKDLEKEIRDLENIDIVGLVRSEGHTLESFSALMQQLKDNPIPRTTITKEVSDHEQAPET